MAEKAIVFITLPRAGDDGFVSISVGDIVMVVANADEGGIIEGTAAIYVRHGPAVAVNMAPEAVMAALTKNAGVLEQNYLPPQNPGEVN